MTRSKIVLLIVAAVLIAGGLWWWLGRSPVAPTTPTTSEGIAPFYVTTMTHMEEGKGWTDDKDEDLFKRHVEQLSWAMDLFDEYGAKMTVETNMPFARANTVWDLNFLKEIVGRGHGVGSHVWIGGAQKTQSYDDNVATLKEIKALVDGLVGAENNQGVSGGPGAYNWVQAMADAGFHYTDALTGFAYLSMPLSARPSGWTDQAIRSTYYHDPAPVELKQRTTPFELADSTDLLPDDNGVLSVTDGALGELPSMAEGRKACSGQNGACPFTMEDVDAYFTQADQAFAEHDAGKVGKINLHIELYLLTAENETLLRALLEGIKTRYIDTGKMVWATQLQAYKGYEAWNGRQ
jgi:hypothetical protein